jgi:L-seryl-tRNA(Ser) seleniumtransferase
MSSPARSASPQQRLPAVDRALAWPALVDLAAQHGRALVLEALRAELAAQRLVAADPAGQHLSAAEPTLAAAALQAAITVQVQARVQALVQPVLRRVFNLTGTVLHTNLGRAPLPVQALAAIAEVAAGAANLEYDLASGQRGDRDDAVEAWLRRLTGAEAATVVNNTAAALVLVLAALAKRREVIVSRGELIEIGGAFRLPEIMAAAGCKLREVGSTNRTHLRDHAAAIGPRTAMLLKVHASNFKIEGFTAVADEAELAALAHGHGLPFVVDLGSGALVDLARFGLPHEPTPGQALAAGADLVLFSGDKLLGGPQAGIIVGRADLIAKLKKHPLKRALRCDKLTLAALDAVLRLYGDPDRLLQTLPTLRLLTRPAAEIEALAHRLQPLVAAWWAAGLADETASPAAAATGARGAPGSVEVVPVFSQIGSGALPVDRLPSHALRFTPTSAKRASGRVLDALAVRLRSLAVPVIGRIADGALLLDLRCLEDLAGFAALFAAPASAVAGDPPPPPASP